MAADPDIEATLEALQARRLASHGRAALAAATDGGTTEGHTAAGGGSDT